MTVCKTFSFEPLVKGKIYRRADLVVDLEGHERMASTYYDPPRDELRTFFDEDSNEWNNVLQNGTLQFSHRKGIVMGETPPWERTKIRHVFLHRKNQNPGDYEYIGITIDEKQIPVNNITGKEYTIQ